MPRTGRVRPDRKARSPTGSPPLQAAHRQKRRRLERHNEATREWGFMRDGAREGRPRFIGSGSGIHFIRTVYQLLARQPGSQPVDQQTVPGEDDQIEEQEYLGRASSNFHVAQSESPFWDPSEVITEAEQAAPPSFDELVRWSVSYFENWHPLFPFLNAPAVLSLFEQPKWTSAQMVIVRAIISISLADSRQSVVEGDKLRIPATLVFQNVQDVVTSCRFALSEPSSLDNLRAVVAAQLFMVSMLRCIHSGSSRSSFLLMN
jgi:hypothetical protein